MSASSTVILYLCSCIRLHLSCNGSRRSFPAYPEIQAKAHEELDRVVGRNRLPTIDDEKNLPFIHAIIKVSVSGINYAAYDSTILQEVERCHNPFWLGTTACKQSRLHISRAIYSQRHCSRVEHREFLFYAYCVPPTNLYCSTPCTTIPRGILTLTPSK